MSFKIVHVLMIIIVAFMLYYFMINNINCDCLSNGFSVGGDEAEPTEADCFKEIELLDKVCCEGNCPDGYPTKCSEDCKKHLKKILISCSGSQSFKMNDLKREMCNSCEPNNKIDGCNDLCEINEDLNTSDKCIKFNDSCAWDSKTNKCYTRNCNTRDHRVPTCEQAKERGLTVLESGLCEHSISANNELCYLGWRIVPGTSNIRELDGTCKNKNTNGETHKCIGCAKFGDVGAVLPRCQTP